MALCTNLYALVGRHTVFGATGKQAQMYIGAMLALLRRASMAKRKSLRYACEVSADGSGFRPAEAGCVYVKQKWYVDTDVDIPL